MPGLYFLLYFRGVYALNFFDYALLVAGGFLAGIINTLAGNGSAITLSLLIFSGLPAPVANATNRVGVLAQTLTAVLSLRKTTRTKMLMKQALWYLIPAILGSVSGALLAIDIPEQVLRYVIGGVMLFLLFTLLYKPGRWRNATDVNLPKQNLLQLLLIFATAFYGGFIQMGIGIMLLSVLVLLAGYGIKDANIIKLTLALIFVLPAFLVFAWSGDMLLWPGLSLALGTTLGARLAARHILFMPRAHIYVRRLLIVILAVSALFLLQIPHWINTLLHG